MTILNKNKNIIQCLHNVSEKQMEVSLGCIVRLSQKKKEKKIRIYF